MTTGYRSCAPLILLLALCSASSLLAQAPPLEVTNPTAATIWARGATYSITWAGGGPTWLVDIQLLDQGQVNVDNVALNIPNSGSATYTVPPAIPAGIYYVFVESIDQGISLGWGISEPFTIIEDSVNSEVETWSSVKALFR